MAKLLLSLALVGVCVAEIVYLDKWHRVETVTVDAQYAGEAVMICAYLLSILLLMMALR